MPKKYKKISLFGSSSTTKSTKSKRTAKSKKKSKRAKRKPKTVVTTHADKIYKKLKRKGLAKKCHIYQGGTPCESIALFYVDNGGMLIDTDLKLVCAQANKTKPHHYYHYKNLHFYEYDSWLLSQVLKSLTKKK